VDSGSCLKVALATLGVVILLLLAATIVADRPWGGTPPSAAVHPPASAAPTTARPCTLRGSGAISFQDPGFPAADWTDTLIAASLRTASFDVAPVASGGPDGGGYRAVHHVFAGSGVIEVLHLQRAAVYDAGACGPIAAVDVAFAVEDLGRGRQLLLFAVRQGGVVYATLALSVDAPRWTPVSVSGLHALDFSLYAGSGPAHPDFSTGLLEFGYVTADSCGTGLAPPCPAMETTTGLGAWSVTLHR